MRRVVIVCLILLTASLGRAFADEPTGPIARKLAQLRKSFETDEKALKKKMADAKAGDDKQQIAFLTKELHALTASDALDLAEEAKKDPAGLDALLFGIKLLMDARITGPDADKATATILEKHVDNPKIQPVLEAMSEAGQPGLNFIESVVEKAMNKEVQALALFYNGIAESIKAAAAEGPKGDPDKIETVRLRAEDMVKRAVKLAPDAKIGEDTLAKAAEFELIAMRIGVGKPVPEVEGTDLAGKKVKLSSMKGKVVLLDFWATWCPPCLAMIPHERELVEKMKAKPFVLLSVSVDEDKSTLEEFLGQEKMPWSHWHDGTKGRVHKTFKIRSFPTLFLIDAQGIVRKKWLSNPGDETLDKAVEELVEEVGKKK